MRKKVRVKKQVPKHFWGAAIGAAASLIGSGISANSAKKEEEEALRLQQAKALGQNFEQDRLEKEEFEREQGNTMGGYYRAKGGKISKYANGGGGGTDPKKKLSSEQVDEINDSTGLSFTDEGANTLFTTRDKLTAPKVEDLDLGIYKDYFEVNHENGRYNVSNTEKNPHNADTVSRLYPYIKKRNEGKKLNMNFSYKAFGGDLKKKIATKR